MMGLCLCGCLRLTDLGGDEEGAEIDRACSSCEGGGHFGLFLFACYGHGLISGYVGCIGELGRGEWLAWFLEVAELSSWGFLIGLVWELPSTKCCLCL